METTIPFQGFYYSIHAAQLDHALESTFSDSTGNPIPKLVERAFDLVDWSEAHLSYAKYYAHEFSQRFGLETLKFKLLCSPKYYNFETDRIICEIDISEITRLYNEVPRNQLIARIKDRFTSRDGFISHYPNDIAKWGDIDTWDHNQVGTLLEAYCLNHEDYPDFEYHILDSLDDKPHQIIYQCLTGEGVDRLYKIGEYLRNREYRTPRS